MRDDFAVFILTHRRPDKVITYLTLKKSGYTGRVFLVIDDEDPTLPEYRERYGDQVLVFSKDDIAGEFDQGDNFTERASVFYARNACWALAERVGCRYFIQLDDDYYDFMYRTTGRKQEISEPQYHGWMIGSIDRVFEAMVEFVKKTKCLTLAMSQGGEHFGGAAGNTAVRLKRKAMNSFVCDVQRPFAFLGRVNEDVSTYVSRGNRGGLFFTYMPLQLDQISTQAGEGGMTGIYLDGGTYLKSFYSVMYAPSAVRVAWQASMGRLHHRINWNAAVPKILHERHRHTIGVD